MISTPLQPSNPAVDFLFRSVESLQIAYQSDGLFLIPDLGINLIGDIDPTQAYRVFCDEEETVSIVGDSLPFDTEYSLHADQWNWIGHPFQSDVDVTVACESITENIIIMLTDDGRLWIPGEPINTIGDMQPGEGYFGFVTEDVTFQYDPPGFGNYRGVIRPEIASNSPAAEFSASTGLPCAILVQLSDDLHHLNPARIEVYDGDLLVGAATVPDDKTTIL